MWKKKLSNYGDTKIGKRKMKDSYLSASKQ